MCQICENKLARRGFLGMVAGGVAACFMPAGVMAARGTTVTATEALAKLKAGNAKYVAAPELCEANLKAQRTEVAKGQKPWATILGCVDSRTSPECCLAVWGLVSFLWPAMAAIWLM